MGIEIQIKQMIRKRYGNIKTFALRIGIPYSTLRSMLERGFLNSSLQNVITVCKALGIDTDGVAEGVIRPRDKNDFSITPDEMGIVNNYRILPSPARKIVDTILKLDYDED